MKKLLALILVIALMLSLSVPAFAAEETETATITVHMTDYGYDGWDSENSYNYVVALSEPYTGDDFEPDEAIVLAECTFADGYEETATFTIDKMQKVYFYWVEDPNSYAEECGFTIYRDGTEVYSHVSEAEEGVWACALEDGKLFFTSEFVDNRGTTVTFNVDPAYTITIPATVELEKTESNGTVTYENDYTITAEAGVRLHKGDTIVVTVSSDYEMTAQQGATLDYTITHKNGDALTDSIVATFTTNTEEQSSTIHIAANDPEFAGDYSDIVTFTISVKKPTISFTINGVTYQAEEGMNWAAWVNSAYNNGGFRGDINAIIKDGLFVSAGGALVCDRDPITANAAYDLISLEC